MNCSSITSTKLIACSTEQFAIHEVTFLSLDQDGYVSITIRVMITTRTTAKKVSVFDFKVSGYIFQELFCYGGNFLFFCHG